MTFPAKGYDDDDGDGDGSVIFERGLREVS